MGFEWSDDMIHVDFGLVTRTVKNCQLVKEISSCSTNSSREAISRAKAQDPEEKESELENKEE